MQEFERDVMPVVQALGRHQRLNPDDVADLVTMAWSVWNAASAPYAPSHFARLASKRLRSQMPLDGMPREYRRSDAWTHRLDLPGLVETFPAPTAEPPRVAAGREVLRLLGARLSGTAARFADLAAADWNAGTMELARDVGCSPARVSQLRREALELVKDLTR